MERIPKITDIRNTSIKAEVEWEVELSDEISSDRCKMHSKVNGFHVISFGKDYYPGDMEKLVAKAKINEIAKSDLENISVDMIQSVPDAQKKLFLGMCNILNNYWSFDVLCNFMDAKKLESELCGLQRDYLVAVKREDPQPLHIIKLFLCLDRFDRLQEAENIDSFSREVLETVLKYGSKPPSLHSLVTFFNSFSFPSEAVITGESSVLLSLVSPLNRLS